MAKTRPPPERILTDRLMARSWVVADAAAVLDAIRASRPELQHWTPWVIPEPLEVGVLEERLRGFQAQFREGPNFIYGLFERDGDRVIGQAGLYGRVGPDALEIGYWIRSDAAGRGYATEASSALRALAFRECGVQRVEIRCEPDHAASAAIARRLGFRPTGQQQDPAHGSTNAIQVWEQAAAEYVAPIPPYTIAMSLPH